MNKVFTILGIIFAVIISLIITAAAIFIPHALKLDHEATAYIQDAVPRIVTNWNSQELVDRATPELLAEGKSREDIDRLFVEFGKLGALKHLDTPEGTVNTRAYTGSGIVTVGNYEAKAEFENGTATIRIQLLRVGGGWKINGFHISSDVFLPPKT
ncbi:MAG TPA: hypothetical protein VMH87_16410 [Pseudomonadales bacterium]|nr:hypothetical protein [Pseudomonadales bacterium]